MRKLRCNKVEGLEQGQKRLDLAYNGRYVWTKGVDETGNVYSSKIEIFM